MLTGQNVRVGMLRAIGRGVRRRMREGGRRWVGMEPLEPRWLLSATPVADFYDVNEDAVLMVSAAQGVLSNDLGSPVSAALATNASNGNVALNADGSFTYTPNANFNGVDTFTYVAQTLESGPGQFVVNQGQSSVTFAATLRTSFGTDSDQDTSSITGTVDAVHFPPYDMIQVTNLHLVLADGISLRFGFGCTIFGCLAGANVDAAPNNLVMDLVEPGPPAAVVGGTFTQLDNDLQIMGTVNIDLTGLANGQGPEGPMDINELAEGIAFENVMISQAGGTWTLRMPVTFVGTFEIDASTTVDVNVNGLLVATAPTVQVPANSAPQTVTISVEPQPDAPVGRADAYFAREDQTLTVPSSTSVTLLPLGSSWRYLDDGSDQGTAWRAVGFNDSSWAVGSAELGYGDGDEATVVGFGPDANNKYITTYFRTTFEVTDTFGLTNLVLGLNRDDGAAVYLNGTEIARSNLAAGALFNTPATAGGGTEGVIHTFNVSPTLLVQGINTLAVEVHQDGPTSSDISFDLRLVGESNQQGVLANDTDADGDVLRAQLLTPPSNGQLTLNSDGTFTYTPNANFSGGDRFTYRSSDDLDDYDYVTFNRVWKYLDDGSDQGTGWRGVGFNDSAWASGPSQLGYGDGDEATVTGFIDTDPLTAGDQRNATTYFRSTFDVSNLGSLGLVPISILRDDAAAVYINGTEVYRDANLPAGAAFNTYATSNVADENAYVTFYFDSILLNSGTNTIAVEVHQSGPTSSDLSFDLWFGSAPVTVTITVAPTNDLPINGPDEFYEMDHGGTLNVSAASGVLANATDPDGDAMVAVLTAGPTHGSVILNLDGSFTYTPDMNYVGLDQFDYMIIDAGAPRTNTTLVPAGSVWKYLDDGSDQGTAWRGDLFNDSGWASGPAELGYGDGGEATVVGFIDTDPGTAGTQRNATTYFRHTFNLADEPDYDLLLVRLVRDDGAAVYLNGVRIVLDGLNPDAAYNEFATQTIAGADESTFVQFLAPAYLLRQGDNVLAVEVHQAAANSSDVSFNLELIGQRLIRTEQVTVLPTGSVWKYLDNGSNQGFAWKELGYDDSSWASGPGELGYGDGDEATVVGFIDTDPLTAGIQRNATTYFRTFLNLPDAAQYESLTMHIRRDDGVAAYVNGSEVARDNLAPAASFNQFALGNAADETSFLSFALDPSLFSGLAPNLIAAEIHQANATSSDISFEMFITGQRRMPFATGTVRIQINPVGGIPGDFNNDSLVNDIDIDLLFNHINTGGSNPLFDLTGDSMVDQDDVDELIRNILGTRPGDANLDRRVNITDLSIVATNFGSPNSGWAQGNFNGRDGTNITDLSLLATYFGFDNSGGGGGAAGGDASSASKQSVIPAPQPASTSNTPANGGWTHIRNVLDDGDDSVQLV